MLNGTLVMQSQARPAGTVGVAEAPALLVNDFASLETLAQASMVDNELALVPDTVGDVLAEAVTEAVAVAVDTAEDEAAVGSELGVYGHVGFGYAGVYTLGPGLMKESVSPFSTLREASNA